MILLHMSVVKAPLCNSGLLVSHLTDVIETPCEGKPIATVILAISRLRKTGISLANIYQYKPAV
jgi:hypothetical protein